MSVRSYYAVSVRSYYAVSVRSYYAVSVCSYYAVSVRSYYAVSVRSYYTVSVRSYYAVSVRSYYAVSVSSYYTVLVRSRFRNLNKLNILVYMGINLIDKPLLRSIPTYKPNTLHSTFFESDLGKKWSVTFATYATVSNENCLTSQFHSPSANKQPI